MNRTLLDRITFVLHEPQNVVNVATAVRAMKNMGLHRLRLVRPAEFDPYRITGIAHRSEDLVSRVEICDSLSEAVESAGLVLGTSARPRTAQRNYGWVADWARDAVRSAETDEVAVIFGREDRGLSNDALDLCHGVLLIPTASDYSSLNLAHAVLIVAYEISRTAYAGEGLLPRGKRSERRATSRELEAAYAALEDGLAEMDFFKGRSASAVMRILRTLIGRARPDTQEAGLVRAVGYEIGHALRRARGGGTRGCGPRPEGTSGGKPEEGGGGG